MKSKAFLIFTSFFQSVTFGIPGASGTLSDCFPYLFESPPSPTLYCTENSEIGTLCLALISKLRPTQMAIGNLEVQRKQKQILPI